MSPPFNRILSHQNLDGQTLLHICTEGGATDAVLAYIRMEADIMAQDGHGRTPLHLAARNGHGPEAPLEPDEWRAWTANAEGIVYPIFFIANVGEEANV